MDHGALGVDGPDGPRWRRRQPSCHRLSTTGPLPFTRVSLGCCVVFSGEHRRHCPTNLSSQDDFVARQVPLVHAHAVHSNDFRMRILYTWRSLSSRGPGDPMSRNLVAYNSSLYLGSIRACFPWTARVHARRGSGFVESEAIMRRGCARTRPDRTRRSARTPT